MNLYTHCKNCKKNIDIKSNADTRSELQMEKSVEFNVKCLDCNVTELRHVNDIKAKPNKTILLIGVIIGLLATIFLWLFYGAIGSISILIPILFRQQQVIQTKSFNSYMVRRK